MENVADALKMAGFVLLFVLALSIAVVTLSQARASSEAIIYSQDKKNDYDYIEPTDESGTLKTSRKVTMADIIPTLYRYNIENYRVEFYKANGEKLVLYTISGTPNTLTLEWIKKQQEKGNDDCRNINYLDLEDETTRGEPWQGKDKPKKFVDKIVYGGDPIKKIDGTSIFSPSSDLANGLLKSMYKDATFKEEIGTYDEQIPEDSKSEEDALLDDINSKKDKKKVIRYTVLDK